MDEHAKALLEDIQRNQRLLADGLQTTNQELVAFRVETVRRFDELGHRMIATDVKIADVIVRLDRIEGHLGIDDKPEKPRKARHPESVRTVRTSPSKSRKRR